MKINYFLCSMVASLVIASCQKDKPEIIVGTSAGGDGTLSWGGVTYAYKIYYHQAWMIDNLAYLPSVSPSRSRLDSVPVYYVYGYQGSSVTEAKATDNYKKYGVLYNWEAAKTPCPPGWRLPTDQGWKTLEKFLGMSASEADSLGRRYTGSVGYKMKSTTDWEDFGNGDNSSGFKVLPGGMSTIQAFSNLNYLAYFWTFTSWDVYSALERSLIDLDNYVARSPASKSFGLSVRCVKDR